MWWAWQQGREPRPRAGEEDLGPRWIPQRQLPHAQLPAAADQQQAEVRIPEVRMSEGSWCREADVWPDPALSETRRQIVSDLRGPLPC